MIDVDDLPIAPPHVYTQIGPNSWTVPSITDLHEPEHRVDRLSVGLFCTCIGFEVHGHCYHLDELWDLIAVRCGNAPRCTNAISRTVKHAFFCDACIFLMEHHEPTPAEAASNEHWLDRFMRGETSYE